jgi:hypothetical protein
VTPYPHEDTGWTIANTSPDVCSFLSDFPHVEGGGNPIARFVRSMDAWLEIHGLQSRLVLAEGFVRGIHHAHPTRRPRCAELNHPDTQVGMPHEQPSMINTLSVCTTGSGIDNYSDLEWQAFSPSRTSRHVACLQNPVSA